MRFSNFQRNGYTKRHYDEIKSNEYTNRALKRI